MADQHTETAEHGSDGQDGQEQPTNGARLTREQQHERDKAAFLAGDVDADTEGKGKSKAKPRPATSDDDDLEEDDDDLVSDDDDDLDDDEVDDESDDDDEEAGDEDEETDDDQSSAAADPEQKRRLDAVRKTEQRARAALARDRQAFEAERREWHAQAAKIVESHQRFEKLSARAKYDPTGVLLALGLTEDDLEHAGKQVYARSKASTVKPEHREAADKAAREREHADELAATKKRLEELEGKLTEREKVAAADAQIDKFFSRVAKIAKGAEDAPLTKQYLAANPKRARAELEKVAAQLAEKTGALPHPRAVIRAHEKQRTRELRDMGIKLDTAAERTAAARIDTTKAAPAKPKAAPSKPAPKSEDTDAPRINGAGIKLPSKADLLAEDWSDAS